MSTKHAAVIGGGVIGAACAYYLVKSGWRVTVVDQGQFGKGCSHGNCGIIARSHVLPLTEPGAVFKTLKTAFKKNSPFFIKPRVDFGLWKWLFQFARRCNEKDMLAAARARNALLESSMTLFLQLLEDEDMDCEWEQRGCLFVYLNQSEMDKYAKTNDLLTEHFHLPAKRYDGEALLELEPALKPACVGGWHYECDAHVRPDKLMSSWRKVLEHKGVTIRESCEWKGFAVEKESVRAMKAGQEDIEADAFVVATGAWTPKLNEHLGCKIPIQPGKGYSITMPRPAQCPKMPILLPEHKVGVTPMQSGYRLGSTMEFAGYDETIHPRRLALLKEGAAHYLLEPHCEPVQEEWYGWRPMTYDGIPIIDRSPAMKNVIIAAGHNMLGLSMAPATGKMVAEILNGEQTHVESVAYAIRRFMS